MEILSFYVWGRTKEVLAENSMDDMIYSTPVVVGDTLYIATKRWLYAIGKD